MTGDALTALCRSMSGAAETFPFEPGVPVFKAPNGKVFAIVTERAGAVEVSVKCEPALGEALRAQHRSIEPGYHLNKKHWITVRLGGDVPDERVCELVLDSYEVVAG